LVDHGSRSPEAKRMTPEHKRNIPLGLCDKVVARNSRFCVVGKTNGHPVHISRLFFAPLLVLGTIAGYSSKEEKPAPPPLGVTTAPVLQKDVPIYQEWVGSMVGNVDAKITFEKSVTQAFGEVSTSLSAHQELAKAYAEQLNSIEAYRESVRLSSIRYDSGLASYLEIIDAEIQMYPAERSAIVYDLGRKVALVNLYRALEGGWNLNDAQWVSTSGGSAPAQPPTP
jgi:hypothetical protein